MLKSILDGSWLATSPAFGLISLPAGYMITTGLLYSFGMDCTEDIASNSPFMLYVYLLQWAHVYQAVI
jgi:hypothetical protein